jgi:hypothetical protein
MKGKKINLTRRKFGRLLVIRQSSVKKNRRYLWECRCDCGNTTTVYGHNLRLGLTTSCGCFRKEKVSQIAKGNTHRRVGAKIAEQRAFLGRLKYRAKTRGVAVNMPDADLLLLAENPCFFCGKPPIRQAQIKNKLVQEDGDGTSTAMYYDDDPWAANNISLITPSEGYTDGNCVPCCVGCSRKHHPQRGTVVTHDQ